MGALCVGALCMGAALCAGALGSAAAGEPKRVAIASFGPHGSLTQVMDGFKAALADQGFADGTGVVYTYSDGNFDPSLIPQVLGKMQSGHPDLLLTVTTPMTQAAVKLVRDPSLPIVFAPVTDPVRAGLVPDWTHGSGRFVGASNLQSMGAVIAFAKELLPKATSFGLLYNAGDANDIAGRDDAEAAAKAAGLAFKAVSVESVNDIAQRATALAGTDFIYAMPSNLIMPALPALAATADRLKIPVISSSPQGVQDHVVLASYSVSWTKVGYQAGLLAARILEGAKPSDLPNYKPSPADHSALIDGRRLKQSGRALPAALADCKCVVE